MTTERWLRLIAGVFVGATAALAALMDMRWLWFTGFVALNLVQSAFTDWCPMKWLLERLGGRSATQQAPRHG
ncbi:MAG: DUF2892 domain-containing protein [Chthonomonadales bacterium]|nr:DUF2892 domain-containing protein [Chthonomonadales bacterium]